MDLKKIKQLINLVEEAKISHFSIEEKGIKIEIDKESSFAPQISTQPTHPVQQSITLPSTESQSNAQPKVEDKSSVEEGVVEIKAQMVGTFYQSSGPDSDPFVSVGDTLTKGKVICIIEAMKLFNEIESEITGTVTEICVENESPVEFGQVLFKVKP